MEPADADAVYAASTAAFEDLERRLGGSPDPAAPGSGATHRVGRFVRTDPGGAWVAERDGGVVGGALAIVREGVWGLSLLVVRPDAQSSGAGRELLARAFAYGEGARGHIVLASRDPRALRAYARLGLALHPALAAVGRAQVAAVPELRPGPWGRVSRPGWSCGPRAGRWSWARSRPISPAAPTSDGRSPPPLLGAGQLRLGRAAEGADRFGGPWRFKHRMGG